MRRKSLIGGVSAVLCVAAAAAAPSALGAGAGRTDLAGTAAPAVVQSNAVGAVSSSSAVSFELVLKLRDEAGAEALLKAVSTPGSASYRHYVTAAQWEAMFSPTGAQVAQAEQWLQSAGFAV
jgi:subtilase family serine protease